MDHEFIQNHQNLQIEILLKGDEVAKILNVSRAFAFQLMQRGDIPTVRLGRAVRVRPVDLERFITASISQNRLSEFKS